MASEKRLWDWLRKGLAPYGDLMRVENLVESGTPDVNFVLNGHEGWLEMKYIEHAPARSTTAVFKAKGLRPEQKEWIVRRVRARGRVFIGAKVGQQFFLWPGRLALRFNEATLAGLQQHALYWNTGRCNDWGPLVTILTTREKEGLLWARRIE